MLVRSRRIIRQFLVFRELYLMVRCSRTCFGTGVTACRAQVLTRGTEFLSGLLREDFRVLFFQII